VVHPADITDRLGAKLLLEPLKGQWPRLQLIWADAAYQGALEGWVQETLGWTLAIVRHPDMRYVWLAPGQEPPVIERGFRVLPRRWVVERSFAWMGRYRRLSKDYEYLTETSEALIYVAMSRLMLRRLAK
jgi:putative transposase